VSPVRDQFSVASRQTLSQSHPSNYVRSDLTNFSLVVEWVGTWRNNRRGKIHHKDCPRCILACDALACKPSAEVTAGGLKSIDVSDFDFDCNLFDSFLTKDSLISCKSTGIELSTQCSFSRINYSIQTSDLSSLLFNPPPTGSQGNSTRNYYKTYRLRAGGKVLTLVPLRQMVTQGMTRCTRPKLDGIWNCSRRMSRTCLASSITVQFLICPIF
jgi:hypothetical protein